MRHVTGLPRTTLENARRIALIRICIIGSVLGLCACGGGSDNDSGPTSGGGNNQPPADAFTQNNATVFTNDTFDVSELSVDANGDSIVRTKLAILFKPTATQAQVTAVLTRTSATVTAAIAGARSVSIRIPDPGTVDALEAIIADISAEPFVDAVFKSVQPIPDALPDNVIEGNTNDYQIIDNQLAVRGAAAWNARAAIVAAPNIIVMDFFGYGASQLEKFLDASVAGTVHDGGVDHPEDHGYHVAGIIAGSYGGGNSAAGLVTGMFPGHSQVHVIDLSNGSYGHDANVLALISAAEIGGTVVMNTSLGSTCHISTTSDSCRERLEAMQAGIMWADMVRAANLETSLFHATSAGNRASPRRDMRDTQTQHWFSTAATMDDMETEDGVPVPPLSNTMVVENLFGSASHPKAVDCLSRYSFTGGHIGAIGENVTSLLDIGAGQKSGTSMSAPQVAGLAAYLLGIDPMLTPQEIKHLLLATAEPVPTAGVNADCATSWQTQAPAIDAYAAVLALDRSADAPVRSAILDISNDGTTLGTNNQFDEFDLRYFVQAIDAGDEAARAGTAIVKYSRADLNGDGYDGGIDNYSKFNLDMDYPPVHTSVMQMIEGMELVFNEGLLTDNDILCYYAYSDLYTGSASERTGLMANRCGLCSGSATITGYRNGSFSGPAGFQEDEVGWSLDLVSLEWAVGCDDCERIENAYGAKFYFEGELPAPGTDVLIGNTEAHLVQSYDTSDLWFFGTTPDTGECATCGGTITINGISADGSTLFGEIDFTGIDGVNLMEGNYDRPDLSRLQATFRAARGDSLDAETPYGQCTVKYWQLN